MLAADKGVLCADSITRYPVPECPGPSAPSDPNAGGLWRELPLAVDGFAEPAGLAGGVPLEGVGEPPVSGLGFVPGDDVLPDPVPLPPPPPSVPVRDVEDWRT
ncbi:MAG TPA: hypothetical protein VFB39_02250 [Solirubrobacteraceae bacterium]|nr:hypothetical protein [Solirubrobacteraceae bacterium]